MSTCEESIVVERVTTCIIAASVLLLVSGTGSLATSCTKLLFTYDCSQRQLTSIPQDIPSTATQLRLSENNISSLVASTLARYSNLKTLYLNHNILRSLLANSFPPLPLQKLYLNNNLLYTLAPGAFNNITQLYSLDLTSNFLQSVPPELFQPIKKLRYLYIGFNSFLKDSHLCAFYNLYSDIRDARDLRTILLQKFITPKIECTSPCGLLSQGMSRCHTPGSKCMGTVGSHSCLTPVKLVQFQPLLNSLTVQEGQKFECTFIASGNPKPDLKLYRNGVLLGSSVGSTNVSYDPVQNNISFSIAGVFRNESGVYRFTAENVVNNIPHLVERNISLNVALLPLITSPGHLVDLVTIPQGKRFDYVFSATGNPKPEMKLYRDAVLLASSMGSMMSSHDLVNNTLSFSSGPLLRNESGMYRLTAENIINGKTYLVERNLAVIVTSEPTIIPLPSTKVTYLREGSQFTFSASGNPRPQLSLFFRGELLLSSLAKHTLKWTGLETESLTINMLRNMTGPYRLVAKNIINKKTYMVESSIRLVVKSGPVITLSKHTIVEPGRTISLSCTAECNPAPSTIAWAYANNTVIKSNPVLHVQNSTVSEDRISGMFSASVSLTITRATLAHSGNYLCIAFNGMRTHVSAGNPMTVGASGTSTATLTLTVQPHGVLPSNPTIKPVGKFVREVDRPFILTCSSSGQPIPAIKWYSTAASFNNKTESRKGSQITTHTTDAGKREGSSVLLIERVHLNDSGKYWCIADNQIAQRPSHSVQLSVVEASKVEEGRLPVFVGTSVGGGAAIVLLLALLLQQKNKKKKKKRNALKQRQSMDLVCASSHSLGTCTSSTAVFNSTNSHGWAPDSFDANTLGFDALGEVELEPTKPTLSGIGLDLKTKKSNTSLHQGGGMKASTSMTNLLGGSELRRKLSTTSCDLSELGISKLNAGMSGDFDGKLRGSMGAFGSQWKMKLSMPGNETMLRSSSSKNIGPFSPDQGGNENENPIYSDADAVRGCSSSRRVSSISVGSCWDAPTLSAVAKRMVSADWDDSDVISDDSRKLDEAGYLRAQDVRSCRSVFTPWNGTSDSSLGQPSPAGFSGWRRRPTMDDLCRDEPAGISGRIRKPTLDDWCADEPSDQESDSYKMLELRRFGSQNSLQFISSKRLLHPRQSEVSYLGIDHHALGSLKHHVGHLDENPPIYRELYEEGQVQSRCREVLEDVKIKYAVPTSK